MKLSESMTWYIYERVQIYCPNPHEVDWQSVPEEFYNVVDTIEVLEPTRAELGITAPYNPHVYSDDIYHIYMLPLMGFMMYRKVGERCGNTITLAAN